MLHGINPDKEIYEITQDLPEQVLKYVSAFDKKDLLPVNTSDSILFSEKYMKVFTIKVTYIMFIHL